MKVAAKKANCSPDVWFALMGCRGFCVCGWVGPIRKSVGKALGDAEKHSGKKWNPSAASEQQKQI